MKESKEHLNVDFEFLDKDVPIRVPPKSEPNAGQTPSAPSSGSPTLKNILIIGGILLFIGWGIYSNYSNSSPSYSSSYSNTNSSLSSTSNSYSNSSNNIENNTFTTAEGKTFLCSGYDLTLANNLEPSDLELNALEFSGNTLDKRIKELDVMAVKIDATNVDMTDQSSVDKYDTIVNIYNTKLKTLQSDIEIWEKKKDDFNKRIKEYNNFLIENCTLE